MNCVSSNAILAPIFLFKITAKINLTFFMYMSLCMFADDVFRTILRLQRGKEKESRPNSREESARKPHENEKGKVKEGWPLPFTACCNAASCPSSERYFAYIRRDSHRELNHSHCLQPEKERQHRKSARRKKGEKPRYS